MSEYSTDFSLVKSKRAEVSSIGASIATATLLYPFEYYKSISQLAFGDSRVLLPQQPKYFFAGLGALNLSLVVKTHGRFAVYNYLNSKFDVYNTPNNPGVLISALMAGITESFLIVPFENVKMNLITSSLYNSYQDTNKNPFGLPQASSGAGTVVQGQIPKKKDNFAKFHEKLAQNSHKPQNSKLLHSTNVFTAFTNIYKYQGIRGFLRGTGPTILRQSMSSIGFFSIYNSLKQLVDPNNTSDSNVVRFMVNFATSAGLVAATQPLDVIKSRLQSSAYTGFHYSNSLQCAYRIYMTEGGISKLYSGSVPRLAKFSVEGSFMLFFFGYFENVFNLPRDEKLE